MFFIYSLLRRAVLIQKESGFEGGAEIISCLHRKSQPSQTHTTVIYNPTSSVIVPTTESGKICKMQLFQLLNLRPADQLTANINWFCNLSLHLR